ncbi:MAG: DUF6335 family protein [Vicinamibacterales bacterium]
MAKKKSVRNKRNKRTKTMPAKRKTGARAQARTPSGKRKKAGPRTAKGPAKRKKTKKSIRAKSKPVAGRKRAAAPGRSSTAAKSRPAPKGKKKLPSAGRSAKRAAPRRGGTGRESELDQTPETGRSVRGRTNPMPTVRSTGTAAGAGSTRHAPGLDRARKQLREVEEMVQGPPSSLDPDRRGSSAAASGRRKLQQSVAEHNETSPAMTGGDVDADWEEAYAVGDEAPGGDNQTPDQDRVDDIGKALGVVYEDNEELKASDKIAERDRHRWELDPASSDDYKDRG